MIITNQKEHALALAISLSIILVSGRISNAESQGNLLSKGISGLAGAASGAIEGGIAGAKAGAEAAGNSSSNGSSSASASASIQSGSSSGGSSMSLNANAASSSSSSGGSSFGSSSQASASLSIGSTTSKPEGLLGKMKEIFKESKEMVKNSIDSVVKPTSNEKKDDSKMSMQIGASASSSSGSQSKGFGTSDSHSGSSSQASAYADMSFGSTVKPEGLMTKISDMAMKGKEAIEEKRDRIIGHIEDKKYDLKNKLDDFKPSGHEKNSEEKMKSGSQDKSKSSQEDKSKIISEDKSKSNSEDKSKSNSEDKFRFNFESKAKFNSEGKKDKGDKTDSSSSERKDDEGPVDKLSKLVAKGTDKVTETFHKIEDKTNEITDKVSRSLEENVFKPMQSTSGSGHKFTEGKMTAHAEANAQLKGSEREKYLIETKRKQESENPNQQTLKEIVAEAKAKGIIPKNEDRSALRGNHADEKSVAVEVMDKAHEMSKIPVETVLKPLDKMLGYEKDPLMRIYDNTYEILRKPVALVTKPVESMLNGAFKTSDEAKKDQEKLLATSSEQERKDKKKEAEKAKKEDRSVLGGIADKTLELATKPFEIVLKPIDHVFGLDKDGRKNPLLKAIDDFYAMSKKPLDAFVKPLERILKKMGEAEQMFEVSVRINGKESSDPKIFTRLADGSLNIFDRFLTKPLEMFMKPLNHALGFDEPGKKNPIVEAAHSLKNATKLGFELWTKPIDRIIKEIAEIGEIQDEDEREAEFKKKKEEASRLVRALDKFHQLAQSPFEIVLKPVSRVLGLDNNDEKEPILRAWDIIHQVIRTPLQVISKPIEEAFWGEDDKKSNIRSEASVRANSNGGSIKGSASASLKVGNMKANFQVGTRKPGKKNIFTDNIKKAEMFAAKPLAIITSPIRRMILGEDDEKVGTEEDKSNKEIQAKANNRAVGARSKQPDKIVKTLTNMNNVLLKPLEVITQPLSDAITGRRDRKTETKTKSTTQSSSDSKSSAKSSSHVSLGGDQHQNDHGKQQKNQSSQDSQKHHSQMSASASASASSSSSTSSGPKSGSASASAQIKRS